MPLQNYRPPGLSIPTEMIPDTNKSFHDTMIKSGLSSCMDRFFCNIMFFSLQEKKSVPRKKNLAARKNFFRHYIKKVDLAWVYLIRKKVTFFGSV